ncbi:HAD hydrolase family protein [Actinomyces bowdenii]|uniref:HAD hydrolase family protein n=1 Tax=Actinomyces bowdenii TaxID=131109 RepID=UPI001ABD2D7B|nr:HAD hydrolase family protein [Actinomyces bowdenii]MBO3723948.1 HAD hydrolase family protein [Actinomyces bowdenii]
MTDSAAAGHPPSLVAFDLDDTLAPSKTAIPAPMARALRGLLEVVPVCIISGGQIGQFRNQVLAHLQATPAQLAGLHLMPTCGTRYYTYEGPGHGEQSGHDGGSDQDPWRLVYANDLSPEQVREGFEVVEAEARRLGLWEELTWGPALEDRGSQITFSALGQEAPLEAKAAWDPTGEKKNRLRSAVAARLPALEVRSGGSTSVDITLKGVDKAYGMRRLARITGIALEDMLFIGDRLDPDGNDYPVKALGVPCWAVTGWQDTVERVTELTARLSAGRTGAPPAPASAPPADS